MAFTSKLWNARSSRRLLIDMHVGDWNPHFLEYYDPAAVRDQCLAARADAVMLYFQSHVGLCYWPTKSGQQHSACQGRDWMADAVQVFRNASLPVCAYYSVNFNNWAYLQHPEWRVEPANTENASILHYERYGVVCLNNPEYRSFLRAQVAEIANYEIDACFFDMLWWNGVCLCKHCQRRSREELGFELPRTIDWLDPDWCSFQSARERWIMELACELRDNLKRLRPHVQVYHNFALALADWTRAISFESARGHDFLGGDFYGGREEQLVVSRLMLNLSESLPVEFMTTVTSSLIEHEVQRSAEELSLLAGAATACASAFLLIAPVNPDGTLQGPAMERARVAFEMVESSAPWLGGRPIEEIAVYCSSDSKMNFLENGCPVDAVPATSSPNYPHGHAVTGACRNLQQAHLPFGVITRRQLGNLDRYKVIVLPNVLRMTPAEIEAFRNYVRRGGNLYASGYTSLTESAGIRHEDFLLSDLFGCHYEGAEPGSVVYARPELTALLNAIEPDLLVTHRRVGTEITGAVRIRVAPDGVALASLTLPYGYPDRGTVHDHQWASIHTTPPWERTDHPVIVEHKFDAGKVIYAAIDLERGGSEAHNKLFLALIGRLLGSKPSFESDAHPNVWMTVFEQEGQCRQIISFLNYQTDIPVLPVQTIKFTLRPPSGKRYKRLLELPDAKVVPAHIDGEGTLSAQAIGTRILAMYAAEYEDAST